MSDTLKISKDVRDKYREQHEDLVVAEVAEQEYFQSRKDNP